MTAKVPVTTYATFLREMEAGDTIDPAYITPVGAALLSGYIWVGAGTNLAAAVAMSGDATLANTGALTLATVNGNVGSFTLTSVTADAKGRILAVSSGTAVTSLASSGSTITVSAATGAVNVELPNLITPGTYTVGIGLMTNGTITVDAQGRITAIQEAT